MTKDEKIKFAIEVEKDEIKNPVGRPKGSNKKRGRPKGSTVVNGAQSPIKSPSTVKEMTAEALNRLGGTKYLIKIAKADPKTFMTMVGKLIPSETKNKTEHSGTVQFNMVPANSQEDAEKIKKANAAGKVIDNNIETTDKK